MHMADSLHCMAETNTNYKAIIQKKKDSSELSLPTCQNGHSRTVITVNAGEDLGQQELSFIAGGNAK